VGFEFVDFDTNAHVVKNPHIRGLTLENLTHILTSRCVTSYYPVRTLTYALDYQIWGLNPAGFKLTNGLIHLGNVLLLFWLVLRLLRHPAVAGRSEAAAFDVLVAAVSAALFAVHPVVVEPMAWVPGREELLMTFGALGCFHFYLTSRRLDGRLDRSLSRKAAYIGAALCCIAACLSNAVGAVIPLLITAWDVLSLPSPKLRKLLTGASVLWLIAAATILGKGHYVPADATATVPRVFSYEWLLMIVSAYGLNLKTVVWPAELGILYEWFPSYGFRRGELILGGIAIVVTAALLWMLRRRTVTVFGLVWFVLALGPTAQIIPHHIARADRFLYLPLVGLVITAAAVFVAMGRILKRSTASAAVVTIGLLGLLVEATVSTNQLQTWQNSYTMWKNCLRVSPNNPMAHRCFAEILANRGRFDQAIPHYHMALRVEPESVVTLHSFALRLATCEEHLRDYRLAIEFAQRGCEITAWKDSDLRLTLAVAHASYATNLVRHGDYRQAISHLSRAMEADPEYDVAYLNLAMLLATCSDPELRQPDEAVTLAERGCDLAGQPDSRRLSILAAAYAASGRFDMAITTTEAAIATAHSCEDRRLQEYLEGQLSAYRKETLYLEVF